MICLYRELLSLWHSCPGDQSMQTCPPCSGGNQADCVSCRAGEISKVQESVTVTLLHFWILVNYFLPRHLLPNLHGLLVNPEDGGRRFLRTVDELLSDYTALHPRSRLSSYASGIFFSILTVVNKTAINFEECGNVQLCVLNITRRE
jgi:hypothetical protein